MKKGDRAFFYHSNEGKEVVGIVEIVKEHHPDPTDEPASSSASTSRPPTRPLPDTGDARCREGRAEACRDGAPETVAPVGAAGDRGGVEARLQNGRIVSADGAANLAITDPVAFIRANTRLRPVPLVPNIVLHTADEAVPLWSKTEEELGEAGLPPPFWAFAWAGGQALARFVIDHPGHVAEKTIIDFATGSGLVAIAAMKAGASSVFAYDIDAFARTAIALNAAENGVTINARGDDLLGGSSVPTAQTILAGDIFYERDTAERAFAFLSEQAARGATVLIGDPGRSYLPKDKLRKLAEYRVPVTRDLEDAEIKNTAVWTLA
jgi:predicted nicotinamide N-methyase